ncbi:MAG: hypothetical protein AAFY60_02115, partial [Myxococcota bacterium]
REVLEQYFERSRLATTMERLRSAHRLVKEVQQPTPLGLPLVVERVRNQLSTESIEDRIARMKRQWAEIA